MLPRVVAVLVVGVLVPCLAPGSARAETLADALKRQDALSRLVEAWISLAERDPREDQVDEYSKYQDEDWAKRKRNVTAEHLAKILADPAAGKDLRKRAADELQKAALAGKDPDLAPDKRNDLTRRKRFAKEHLLDLIKRPDAKGGDQLGRGLAFGLLQAWFPPAGRDMSEVAAYEPAESKESTWAPAHRAFRDALNK